MLAVADPVGEGPHAGEHVADLGHDVAAVDPDGLVALVPQRGVQDGAVLGAVDPLAGEHPLDLGRHLRLPREFHQQGDGLVRDAVLRVVDEDVPGERVQAVEAARIGVEEVAQVQRSDLAVVVAQGGPGGQVGGVHGAP